MSPNTVTKLFDKLSGFIDREPIFVRSIYAGSLLEDFFVSAVGAVLPVSWGTEKFSCGI